MSGLNIEGICCTPSCRIFGQTAVYALGQEVFDMCIDAALCPCCKAEMHITNAGFHDCAWRIQGVKKHGEHEQIVKTIARQVNAFILLRRSSIFCFRQETDMYVVILQNVEHLENGIG